ncbi:MAG: hypothetical protein V4465_01670 [Patescibacteria group bacterium]
MNTQPRVLKWSVIIGIVIVTNLFLNYAISLVYKSPDYLAYCPNQQVNEIVTKDECVAVGGQWNAYPQEKVAPTPVGSLDVRPVGYCDPQFTCRQEYDTAQKSYDRNIFVALVALGALLVLLGNFFKGNDVISQGLSLAGVLSFIIASMRYWGNANDAIRVLILGIALLVLFWVAYKKFKN